MAFSTPVLVGPAGEQEYATGKPQSRLAGLSGMVDVICINVRETSLCNLHAVAANWPTFG